MSFDYPDQPARRVEQVEAYGALDFAKVMAVVREALKMKHRCSYNLPMEDGGLEDGPAQDWPLVLKLLLFDSASKLRQPSSALQMEMD